MLVHAKLFFEDFRPASAKDSALLAGLTFADSKLREYLGYVLLDFVTADPELDDMPLAAALELCRELNVELEFEKLAFKELKMKERELKRVRDDAATMLASAEVGLEWKHSTRLPRVPRRWHRPGWLRDRRRPGGILAAHEPGTACRIGGFRRPARGDSRLLVTARRIPRVRP